MESISAPTETVWFVLNWGTSWVIAHLSIFPLPSCLLLMDIHCLPLPDHHPSRSLVIEPEAQLYEEGNVMILLLFHQTLLISFNTSCHYWRGLHPSNISYSGSKNYLHVWSFCTKCIIPH